MHQIALHIAPDHPAFPGHFPGMPITPGVVLLDEALLAISQHAGLELSQCSISSLKFLSPVAPDTRLTVHYETKSSGAISFAITDQDGRSVATGVFSV